MSVYTQGRITNPTAGTVLADTGALEGGAYFPQLIAAANVATFVEFQVRDAANTANVHAQAIGILANGTVPFRYESDCPCPPGGRYRIVTLAALTGQVQATVVW